MKGFERTKSLNQLNGALVFFSSCLLSNVSETLVGTNHSWNMQWPQGITRGAWSTGDSDPRRDHRQLLKQPWAELEISTPTCYEHQLLFGGVMRVPVR